MKSQCVGGTLVEIAETPVLNCTIRDLDLLSYFGIECIQLMSSRKDVSRAMRRMRVNCSLALRKKGLERRQIIYPIYDTHKQPLSPLATASDVPYF